MLTANSSVFFSISAIDILATRRHHSPTLTMWPCTGWKWHIAWWDLISFHCLNITYQTSISVMRNPSETMSVFSSLPSQSTWKSNFLPMCLLECSMLSFSDCGIHRGRLRRNNERSAFDADALVEDWCQEKGETNSQSQPALMPAHLQPYKRFLYLLVLITTMHCTIHAEMRQKG